MHVSQCGGWVRGCSKLGTVVVDRVPVIVIHAGHGSGEVRGRSVDFLVSAAEEHAGPAGVKECPQAAVEAATVPGEQHLGVDAAPLKLLGGAVGDDPVADEADVVRHLTEADDAELVRGHQIAEQVCWGKSSSHRRAHEEVYGPSSHFATAMPGMDDDHWDPVDDYRPQF